MYRLTIAVRKYIRYHGAYVRHLSMLLLLLMMIWMKLRHVYVSAGGYWQLKAALTPHLNQSCVWSVYQTQYDPNDIHSMLYTKQGTEGGLMPSCKQ